MEGELEAYKIKPVLFLFTLDLLAATKKLYSKETRNYFYSIYKFKKSIKVIIIIVCCRFRFKNMNPNVCPENLSLDEKSPCNPRYYCISLLCNKPLPTPPLKKACGEYN